MRLTVKRTAKWLSMAAGLLLLTGIVAPFLSGNRFAPRIRTALETALGRKVDLGPVHFSLFTGPGFSVDNVVIYENPAIGIEPLAYVGSLEAVPRLASIFGGRLEFSSIRLDDASINIAKTGGPSEPGHWNLEPFLSRSLIRAIPELHVRSGRINFKFGETKSVFYLTDADLDITPPAHGSAAWDIEFSGEPARTDKPARGLGIFQASGRWVDTGVGRLDLNVRLEKSAISEIVELVHGHDAGVHGAVSASLHLAGPLDDIRVAGRLDLENVHRWDLMPPYGQGWPLRLAGSIDALSQVVEVAASTSGGQALPLVVRFRCAHVLSQPLWGVVLNWNGFPAGPVLDLARHMGAGLPSNLAVAGSLDGVLGYSGGGSLQGELDFHDASMAIPDSPPIRFSQAQVVFDGGHARLTPAVARTGRHETAQLAADYDWAAQTLDVTVSTDAMRLESLRAQAGLAGIPWLQHVSGGSWKGQLHYHLRAQPSTSVAPVGPPSDAGWSGSFDLSDAKFPLPGFAEPVAVQSATAHLDGLRVTLDHIRGEAGGIAFTGQYQYAPQAVRPHRLSIRIPQADVEKLEESLWPTLHHRRGLLARAFGLGRASLPGWLANLHVDASVQIGMLRLADAEADDFQAHLLWDAAKAALDNIHAQLDGGSVTGTLAVRLRSGGPAYRLQAQLKGMAWKSGEVDADIVAESSGTGLQLLSNLHSSGSFSCRGLEMDGLTDAADASGDFDLVWRQAGPVWHFPELELVSGDDTYTGQGATGADGRLLIQLSSGDKEMRMRGTLAQLRLEQPQTRP